MCSANFLYNKSEYEKALENYKKSLENERKVYGDDDSSSLVANTLICIGNVFKMQAKYDQALENFEECLNVKRKLYAAEDHPSGERTRMNIQSVLKIQGKK